MQKNRNTFIISGPKGMHIRLRTLIFIAEFLVWLGISWPLACLARDGDETDTNNAKRIQETREKAASDDSAGLSDCNKALQEFEDLVGAYVSLLKQGGLDKARLSAVSREIVELDRRAGSLCLRYYARGIDLYSKMAAAEKESGREPLLKGFPQKLAPPASKNTKRPFTGLFDEKVENFQKPRVEPGRPVECLATPMKADASLVVALSGLALGSAVGLSLLQFDGSTERGFGYAFLLASTTFAPSVGEFRAGADWKAWLFSGLRAGAGAMAVAGLSKGNDSSTDKAMTYGGLVSLGILIAVSLVDGVLEIDNLNELCGAGNP